MKWILARESLYPTRFAILDTSANNTVGRVVGKGFCTSDEILRKMAAADAMYEALKSMVAEWERTADANGWDPKFILESTGARAALAKAEGKS